MRLWSSRGAGGPQAEWEGREEDMGVEQARWGCVCGPGLEAGLDRVVGGPQSL